MRPRATASIVGGGASPRAGIERSTANRAGVFWIGNRSATAPSSLVWLVGNWYVLTMRSTDTDARFEQNGEAVTTATAISNGIDSVNSLDVGRRAPYFAPIEVAEVIVWPTNLTDTQMADVRTALLVNNASLLAV